MEAKKKTNIIALSDGTPYGIAAVRSAATLAAFFQASLTIIPHFSFNGKPAQSENFDYQSWIRQNFPQINTQINKEAFSLKSLHHFADESNSIMYVIGVASHEKNTFFNRKKALKFIKPSRLPVMTVGKDAPTDPQWREVFLSIDIHRQEKEKALWAGYFHRFGKSNLHIIHTAYRDEFLQQKTEDNLKFIDKLYQNLEIASDKEVVDNQIDNIDLHILQNTDQYHPSVLVIMTTKYYSLIDLLLGAKERQLIGNDEGIPVLCINEREDLYVLCT